MTSPKVLTVRQAANRLGISRDTLRRWIHEGRVPAPRAHAAQADQGYTEDEIDRIRASMRQEV